MGELKILGAQRVKALQKILDEQMNESLKEHPLPTNDELLRDVDRDFFSEDWLKKYDELQKEYTRLANELTSVRRSAEYQKTKANINTGAYKYRDEIKKQFSDKKNSLWLCDTMEEAKAIVGLT